MTGDDTDPLETLKRLFTTGTITETTDPDYECRHCHAQFDRQRPVCPECGGRSVEYADWDHSVEK